MQLPDLERTSLRGEEQGPGSDTMTHGPHLNDVRTPFGQGGVRHDIYIVIGVNSDHTVIHNARMAGFFRKLQNTVELRPAGRDTKERIMRCELTLARPAGTTPLTIVTITAAPNVQDFVTAPIDVGSPFGVEGFGVSGFGN